MVEAGKAGARGGPLLMIALVLAAWVGGRALWWENPFARAGGLALPVPFAAAPPPAGGDGGADRRGGAGVFTAAVAGPARSGASAITAATGQRGGGVLALLGSGVSGGIDPRLAAGHMVLWQSAMHQTLAYHPGVPASLSAPLSAGLASPDRLATIAEPRATTPDRWSVDGWGFWRQGSDAAPISQGRVPIYGASQIGAVLTYRLAPNQRRDPRLYARAYRAMVRRGESELALGASLRPVPGLPLRVAGEVRATDGAFRSELRPSAFAVTEMAPMALPLGTRLETYAQAGWVGGTDATVFADGQASVTREVEAVASASDNALRLSLGAGAWGGAQKGAERIDLGPTVRLDLTLGAVPARLAFDWRERVGGDAGPGSGAAVTLSTRF